MHHPHFYWSARGGEKVEPPTKFLNRGLERISIFRGGDFFQGRGGFFFWGGGDWGGSYYIKIRSEPFNKKKSF